MLARSLGASVAADGPGAGAWRLEMLAETVAFLRGAFVAFLSSDATGGFALGFVLAAVAADASFEMDTGPIAFKPTLMFQARTHAVTLRNTGAANLPFECDVFDPRGADRNASPRERAMYAVSPDAGVVAPGVAAGGQEQGEQDGDDAGLVHGPFRS